MKKLKKINEAPKTKQKKIKTFLRVKRNLIAKVKFSPKVIKKYSNMSSPYNTSQFLIANNSSSFYPEEDDSDIHHNFLDLNPTFPCITDIIKEEEINQIFKDSNLDLELNSTAANSMNISENTFPWE
jgi:hypothetical protein